MSDEAKFKLGQVVKHRLFDFRGIIFDVDPEFNKTDEWYERIPEDRPRKDQPFYHLLAENEDKTTYIAYVSQQNLEKDESKLLLIIRPLSFFLMVMIAMATI